MRLNLRTYSLLALSALAVLIAARVYAAEIANVTVSDITSDSATVSWTTDVNTDAAINYGLDTQVGIVRDPMFDKKNHTLTITGLDPQTTYYFRAVSSDEAGNKNATAGFVFKTAANDKKTAQKIIKELDKLKEEEAIKEVVEKIQEVAADVLRPPAIVGSPKVISDTTSATFTWTTDKESDSMVHLVEEDSWSPGDSDPYVIHQGNPNETVTKHEVKVIGLDPSTTYHFVVSSADSGGLEGQTEDDTFMTKSFLPEIQGVRVTRIQQDSASIEWNTGTILAKGTVEFQNLRTRKFQTTGDPVFLTKHSVRLANLEFGTRYSAVITATNQGGDQVVSKPFTFITIRDVVSPTITKVKNESTLYPGEDTKVQTILTWETDEPAFCQVFYSQGLGGQGSSSEPEKLIPESNPVTAHTSVVVGFAPATVYKFWIECHDDAFNQSKSDDFVLITPIKEKNIIDVILENFQGTFGWVGKIGK